MDYSNWFDCDFRRLHSPRTHSFGNLRWRKQRPHMFLFFQFSFRVDIYACKSSHMQKEEIVEFDKRERERERKKSPCSPTLSSTQFVSISSALPAWDLQQNQRRCRVEKTRRQRLKRRVNSPVVLNRVTTWFGSWQILLYFLKGCRQPRVQGGEIDFKEP